MTLNNIIMSALRQLERGTDAQTIDSYQGTFTDYVNEALRLIARSRYKQTRQDIVKLDENGCFNLADLERECIRIETVNGGTGFTQLITGVISCGGKEGDEVKVVYRFMPKLLSSTAEVPEVPERMHGAIASYVVARHRVSSGDPNMQAAAAYHFDLFNRELALLERETHGTPDSFKLKNRW